MKIACEICGSSATDEKEIEKAKKNNICPICLSMGSLYIDHSTEKGGATDTNVGGKRMAVRSDGRIVEADI